MAKIGIYGGSFNPPHLGHIRAAEQTRRLLGLDRVILVPDAIPPHKRLPEGSPDAQTRLRLVQLAAQDAEGLEVSDIELRRSGPSYTVDTLREFHAQYPQDELFLLMGTDMFQCFDQWRGPEQIAQMARIVCMYRTQTGDALAQTLREQARQFEKSLGCRTVFAENQALELSSTQVRRLLFFGCGADCVPEAVMAEIEHLGLYGLGSSHRGLDMQRLEQTCRPLYKPQRWIHAEGCSRTAAALARKYGADETAAARAGILHDMTKALTPEQQTQFCRRYALEITQDEQISPELLHAKTAAYAAEHIFGEAPEICGAIRWHTTGRPDMTTLEKIIYIADYMEPSRDFPGVEALREMARLDLDGAVLLALEQTLRHLQALGRPAAGDSEEARKFLLRNGVSLDEILRRKKKTNPSAK